MSCNTDCGTCRPKLPPWIRVKVPCGAQREHVEELLKMNALNTVCRGAQCPNLSECWHRGTAAFMILGDRCTRNCKFCAVGHVEAPLPPDPAEPENLADAAAKMGLSFVVVTSVTRDDLPDGGSQHFAATIRALKDKIPHVRVEVLVPDFNLIEEQIRTVLDAKPDVYNHNVETVERLTPQIRSKAQYRRSLEVLKTAYNMTNGKIPVKSGIMVGLGETDEEIFQTIRDIRDTGAEFLTVGQYLQPSPQHWPLARYVEPSMFEEFGKFAREIGFTHVASGPLVRSSYYAEQLADQGKIGS